MPKREIYGDRTAYLVTNIKSSSALRYEVELTPAQTSGSETVFSGGVGWGNKYIQFGGIPGGTTLWRAYGNTTGSSSVNWQPGDWATAIVDEGKFYKDSTLLATLSYTDFETDNKMALWCAYRSGTASEKSAGGFRSFKAISKADGSVVGHLIPCKHNGENGMYDIEGMTWHGNSASSGAFTINYTRNGQPWTPSTP